MARHQNKNKTKAQLVEELDAVRRRNAELEAAYVATGRLERLNRVLDANRRVHELIREQKDSGKLLKAACDCLVEAGVCRAAWIALSDDSGNSPAAFQAGLDETFTPLAEQVTRGELPACAQSALTQSDGVVIEDPREATDAGERIVSIRLAHNGRACGVLTIHAPSGTADEELGLTVLRDLGAVLADGLFNIAREKADAALRESHLEPKLQWQRETEERTRVSKNLQDEIAERRSVEERARRKESLLAGVTKIVQAASTPMHEEAMVRTCLAVAQQVTESKVGYFGRPAQGGCFDVIALANPSGDARALPDADVPVRIHNMKIGGLWGRMVKDGQPRIVNEPCRPVRSDDAWRRPAPSDLVPGRSSDAVGEARRDHRAGQQTIGV